VRVVLQLTTDPEAPALAPTVRFDLDGDTVEVPDENLSLLDALRDHLGRRSVKDGCSPQGQCGCCTVWVDGAARVACVTPLRRVAGRQVTTLEGLDPDQRRAWTEAFTDTGASQCGFCTPGIIMRLAALARRPGPVDEAAVRTALLAHLCRCTGWCTILDAARRVLEPDSLGTADAASRHWAVAARRAALEGGSAQSVGAHVARGAGGFADDTAPSDALVAVPDGAGGWTVAESLAKARTSAGKVQGRNSTVPLRHPLELPPGSWALTLRTTFTEPAYLEPDASWCEPGGTPASPLANGGAFGGKTSSPVTEVARRLADEHGRCVRVLMSREDVVRLGPKRPPVAAGVQADGTGVIRVGVTPGRDDLGSWMESVTTVAPGLRVERQRIPGPPVSAAIRGSGTVEAAVLLGALEAMARGEVGFGHPVTVVTPRRGRATAVIDGTGAVSVTVAAGEILDETVLRSYVVGAVHQALGWVRSEGVAVDAEGSVLDLTIRSFGILPARAMPPVTVVVEEDAGPPVPVAEAVMAAVATAAWLGAGLPPDWPTEREGVR
jgi:xanthine dehydrogenase small subunit